MAAVAMPAEGVPLEASITASWEPRAHMVALPMECQRGTACSTFSGSLPHTGGCGNPGNMRLWVDSLPLVTG
eukprot:8584326-Alexandrium_andersonii.AAC.1